MFCGFTKGKRSCCCDMQSQGQGTQFEKFHLTNNRYADDRETTGETGHATPKNTKIQVEFSQDLPPLSHAEPQLSQRRPVHGSR